uniref:Uncharacterized protein n=1 Tax=Panagrolaimus sp. PS1159 TaxID=55785 RepID=A0AC35FK62_9BILA
MVCAERLHATFILKRDAIFQSKQFGYCLVLVTVIISIAWTIPWIISDKIFFYNAFVSIGLHLIVLFMIIALYYYNKRLHIFLAYKVDLKQRFQIVENIKTLKYVRPYLVISSIIAPFGPITVAIIYFCTGHCSPLSVFYTFYNLSYFMCSFFFLFQSWKIEWIIRTKKLQISSISFECTTVKNVFGKRIPAECSTEEYFMNLKKFWDST